MSFQSDLSGDPVTHFQADPSQSIERCLRVGALSMREIPSEAQVIFKELVRVGSGELPNNYEYPVVCSLIINRKLNSLF